MTREEAYTFLEIMATNITSELISDGHLTTKQTELLTKQLEAIDIAIKTLKAKPLTEGRYERAIKTLQEMPKYINSNTIGKKLEVLNYTKEEYNDETRKT